jgi:hypothetical protein
MLSRRPKMMSITTTPDEYRECFLMLCRGIVEIKHD